MAIRNLPVQAGKIYEVVDNKVPGFAIRVFPSGVKSFALLYRVGGRQRRMTLGKYPVVSLAEARRLAKAALNQVAHGTDPQQEKIDRRGGQRFAGAVDRFVETHCARHNRASTARETERILRARFVGRWGTRDVRELSRSDVVTVLDLIVEDGSPSAANHALAAIRKFFSWCVERGLTETNPCAGIGAPAPSGKRNHVLTEDELAGIWKASGEVGYPFGHIVKLLIVTAQRRGEVTGMRWDELDLEKGLWALPPGRTKNNREHVVPLSALALETIKCVPRTSEELVFPASGRDTRSFSGFSKSKRRLDALADVVDWTLHDLRRSAATTMARLKIAPHIIERVLNHTSGILGGVAGIYNQFEYLDEMRLALEAWAAHIEGLLVGDASGAKRGPV